MVRGLRGIRQLKKRPPGIGGGGGTPSAAIALSASSIAENAANGTTVGNLSVVNGTGSYTFTLTDSAGGKFSITAAALKKAAALDYETATSHNITVHADNGAGSTADRTFTITVTNVLEVTLAALTLSASTMDEDAVEDTLVGAIQNKSSGSTIALTDDAGGRFKLTGTNIVAGATLASAADYSITIRETHSDGNNSPRDTVLTITVAGELLDGIAAPTLTWVTDASDNTPQFSVNGDLQVDDEVEYQRSTDVDFTSPDTFTATVDAAADLANSLDYTTGTWDDDEYWVRARINRAGHLDGEWSNVENKTIAVGGAFTDPSDLASLVAWYKSDTGVFSDRGTTPATNTSVVQQWNDQSGNGYHLIDNNAPNFYTNVLNGYPAIRFIAADDHSLVTGAGGSFPVALGGTTLTVYAVVKTTANSDDNGRICSYRASGGHANDYDNTSSAIPLFNSSDHTVSAYRNSGALSNGTIVDGEFHVLTSVFDGVNNTVYIDNIAQTSVADTNTFGATGQFSFGAFQFNDTTPTSGFDGDIVEIVITSNASSTDRDNMAAYFAARYGAANIAVQMWKEAVVTDGGSVSGTQLGRVDTLVGALKTANVWNKLDRLWIYAGESDAHQAKIDLKNRSSHTITVSPTLSAAGYLGNGSTQFIDTNFNPRANGVNYVRGSASIFAYVSASRTTAQDWITVGVNKFDSENEYAYLEVNVNDGGSKGVGLVAGTGAVDARGTVTNAQGFLLISGTSTTQLDLYKNGNTTPIATNSSNVASDRTADNTFYVLGFNYGGSFGLNGLQSPSGDKVACAGFAAGLNATEQAALASAINTYMTAWGVNVY